MAAPSVPSVQPRQENLEAYVVNGSYSWGPPKIIGAIRENEVLIHGYYSSGGFHYYLAIAPDLTITGEIFANIISFQTVNSSTWDVNSYVIPPQNSRAPISWIQDTPSGDHYLRIYRGNWVIDSYLLSDPVTINAVFTSGDGSEFIVASTETYSDGVGTGYMRYLDAYSLTTGSSTWRHAYMDTPYQGDWTSDDYDTETNWRYVYEPICSPRAGRYLRRNISPVEVMSPVDTVSSTIDTVVSYPYGLFPPSTLLPYIDEIITVSYYLSETGETRLRSGGLGAVTPWYLDYAESVDATLYATNISTQWDYILDYIYYSWEHHWIYFESSGSPWGDGSFDITWTNSAAHSSAPYDMSVEFEKVGPDMIVPNLWVVWDNTSYGGGDLELCDEDGVVLDTLSLPTAAVVSMLPYDTNKVFVGQALFNPWNESQTVAENKFYWRTIIVSGDTMTYTSVHEYSLPSHFVWQEKDIVLGEWNGQVFVHPVAYGSCGN